jgi:hypothetical protein
VTCYANAITFTDRVENTVDYFGMRFHQRGLMAATGHLSEIGKG